MRLRPFHERLGFGGRFRFVQQRGLIVGAHYAGPRTIAEMLSDPLALVDEAFSNLVVDQGIQQLMDGNFGLDNGLFVDLIAATPTIAATDTAASHAGWTFFSAYDAATRPAYTGVRTGQVMSNSASLASFTISTGGGTIGGAATLSNNTKGGTTGFLWSAGARAAGNLPVNALDIVRVQYDITGDQI